MHSSIISKLNKKQTFLPTFQILLNNNTQNL
jgi:hypothetical protein